MIIEILGIGCPKCERLEKNLNEIIDELNLDVTLDSVGDFKEIVKYGVMKTPSLVVNGKVEVVGRAPSVKQLKKILAKHM